MKKDLTKAKRIKSKDNGLREKYGTIIFGIRKQQKKDANGKDLPAEKSAIQCAIEYAEEMSHQIIIKFTESKKDHWFGSYETVIDAVHAIKQNKKCYEVITVLHPKGPKHGAGPLARYFHADVEFDPKTLQGIKGEPLPSPDKILEDLVELVCSIADELCGHRVSRKVEISASKGRANSKTWDGVDKASYHIKFDFALPNHESAVFLKTAIHNRIMQNRIPYMTFEATSEKDGIKTKKIKSIFDPAPYGRNQSWRTLYSMKIEDTDPRRALLPKEGSSNRVEDHLIGLYTPEACEGVDILKIDIPNSVKVKRTSMPMTSIGKSVVINASEHLMIPADLLRKVISGLSDSRADDYYTWARVIWATKNITNENDMLDLGLELVHAFSKKSGKYSAVEVDAMWASTLYRQDGLNWGSLKGWLYEDARKLWLHCHRQPEWKSVMRSDNSCIYAEQYLPHIRQVQNGDHNSGGIQGSASPRL